MSDFSLTAGEYELGGNYIGLLSPTILPGASIGVTNPTPPEIESVQVLALCVYADTSNDNTFQIAFSGNQLTLDWCVSFVDDLGVTWTYGPTTTGITSEYTGVFTLFSVFYAAYGSPPYPHFTNGSTYAITDCGSGGGGGDMFNCDCESIPLPTDGYTTDTLANLRKRVLIRSGYAAQAANPPPGMTLLVNEFLRDAQNQLYRQHFEKRLRRLYSWPMVINQRYYGFASSTNDCRQLDPMSIDWVGFEDLNQAWYPLIAGIDPVLYTRAQISTGWPTHYEIRSCIEIFPAPRAAYTLWIKGLFGLDPFVADTDCTTVDAEAVYLLATGMLKAHYSQPDAGALLTQALSYTKYLVAGQHDTRRYVPRTRVQTPMTPPRFLPLEE